MGVYHKPGYVKVVESSKGYCVLRFFDLPPRASLAWEIAGYIERLIELIGAIPEELSINKLIAQGDPYTEMLVRWS